MAVPERADAGTCNGDPGQRPRFGRSALRLVGECAAGGTALLDAVAQRMQCGGGMPAEVSRIVSVTIPKAEVLAEAEFVRCSVDKFRRSHSCRAARSLLRYRRSCMPRALHRRPWRRHRAEDRGLHPGVRRSVRSCNLVRWGVLSLVHGWLFRVLALMQLLAHVVALVRNMCRGNTTIFEVSGSPVAEVAVASGVRQGCPLSGSLFALALDPLLCRAMAHRMLASARLFVGADDLAVVLRRLRAELPELLVVLCR